MKKKETKLNFSRKDFLKLGSTAAAGFLVGSTPPEATVASPIKPSEMLASLTEKDRFIELHADAPLGTKAVRFYINDMQVAELTDLYARQTNTKPVWKTAIDPAWFPEGQQDLRVEADTREETLTIRENNIFIPKVESSEERTSLSGGWKFASAGELPNGTAEGPNPSAARTTFEDRSWKKISVPGSLGYIDQNWNDYEGILGVYRRKVNLEPPAKDEQLSIRLKSCYWKGRVFVNGQEVGQTEGGYLPARFDITEAARSGENQIAIIVDNRFLTMGTFKRLHYFYWNWGGLLQGVSIERNPKVALIDVKAEGSSSGKLRIWPTFVNKGSGTAQRTVQIKVYGPDGKKVRGPEELSFTVPDEGGEGSPKELSIENPRLWDLEHPHLYTVEVETDWKTFSTRTGFRNVEADGKDLLLNGEVVKDLQGFNRHADYPGLGRTQPAGLPYKELKELRNKGFQFFRPAHYPTTPAQLHAADELGMLVIEEINVTGLKADELVSKRVKKHAAGQLTKMIQRDRGHPSIIAWSVGNENKTGKKKAREYVGDTIQLGRSLDDTRLFTQVSNRGRSDKTYEYQDIIINNHYAGWYSNDLDTLDDKFEKIQNYGGGKPIILSEYGGEAVNGRLGTGKGSEYYQSYLIDGHNQTFEDESHFVGKMYWTSTEFWCNPNWSGGNPAPVSPFHVKGLQDYYRSKNKLGWRVMFSPIRLEPDTSGDKVQKTTFGGTFTVPAGQKVTLNPSVKISELNGRQTEGQLIILPSGGFRAHRARQSFNLKPNETKKLDFSIKGRLRGTDQPAQIFVKAVIDGDTEAHPLLFMIMTL